MPYKKKQNKKRYARKRTVMRVQKNIIPDNLIVKLRYVDTITLDAGAGGKAYDTWAANSIFDPYVGAGGHQPMGSDEWAQFYEHYTVLGAKCSAHYQNHAGASSDGQAAVCQVSPETTWTPSTIMDMMEQGRAKWQFLTPAGGSKDQCTVNTFYSPKKLFGVPDPKSSLVLRGLTGDLGTGNSPSTGAYFHVGLAGTQAAGNPGAATVIVTLDYIVYYSGRKTLAQS